jgi:hypothetical protein
MSGTIARSSPKTGSGDECPCQTPDDRDDLWVTLGTLEPGAEPRGIPALVARRSGGHTEVVTTAPHGLADR